MLGQLHDAGNTTTLAHYLDLLGGAGMLDRPAEVLRRRVVRQRGSSPKLQVLNTALMTAQSGLSACTEAQNGPGVPRAAWWNRRSARTWSTRPRPAQCEVYYWRERNREVDFVVRAGRAVVAIEVKSGRAPGRPAGLAAGRQRPRSSTRAAMDRPLSPRFDTSVLPVDHTCDTRES